MTFCTKKYNNGHQLLGSQYDMATFRLNMQRTEIAKESLDCSSKNKHDVFILDTAGRLQTNKELMDELVEIKKTFKPDEIIL